MKSRQTSFGSRDFMQILVFTLVVILGPLLLYPHTLGVSFTIDLTTLIIVEAIYYVIVLSIMNSGSGLPATVVGAMISLVYRGLLSAAFGLMVSAPGSLSVSSSIWLGLNGYWLAYGVFIFCSPFVMLSVVRWIVDSLDTSSEQAPLRAGALDRQSSAISSPSSSVSSPSFSGSRQAPTVSPDSAPTSSGLMGHLPADQNAPTAPPREFAFGSADDRKDLAALSGFERGVRYLGEDASVMVAAVVDPDGLELASFSRKGFDSGSWSPFAVSIQEENSWIFSQTEKNSPNSIEMRYDDLRIDCRQVGRFLLFVVAEIHDGDLLSIRVSQACEMISKYVTARYSHQAMADMEENYVRSS